MGLRLREAWWMSWNDGDWLLGVPTSLPHPWRMHGQRAGHAGRAGFQLPGPGLSPGGNWRDSPEVSS